MKLTHEAIVAQELSLQLKQVEAVAALLAEGGTVPFIARYRKEATGSLDEVAIAAIRDRMEQLAELDKRREAILASLEERNLLGRKGARPKPERADLLSGQRRGQMIGSTTHRRGRVIQLVCQPG